MSVKVRRLNLFSYKTEQQIKDTSSSFNYYSKKQANGLKKSVEFTKGEVQDLIPVFSKLAEAEKDSSEQKGGSEESSRRNNVRA